MTKDIIVRACSQYKTPLYLYDLDKFRENIFKLKSHLLTGSGLYFSIKANPLERLCEIACDSGCGVEIASDGELDIALKAGLSPQNIVFTGPGKTEYELEQAISAGIYMINVESLQEIRKIERIAKRQERKVSIALRINPCQRKTTGKVQMCGVASQFGIEETDLTDEFFEIVFSMCHVQLVGIQIYMGTSILDAEEICKNTEYVIQLGLKLSKQYSFQLKYLNAGGGFGVPYFPNEIKLDLKKLKSGMRILREEYSGKLAGTKLFFESGRYLLAECGLFLVRVLYRKESKGNTYLICDGGSNFHSASAFLGRFVRSNFPMYVLGKEGEEMEFYVTGPSCTPTDLLGQKVRLFKDVTEGDIIVIKKSGAYGLTYSPLGFLSHDLPHEVGYERKSGYITMR